MIVANVPQIQAEFERVGFDTTRRLFEDDHTYGSRLIGNAPPEVKHEIMRNSAPLRQAPCECVECSQKFRNSLDQVTDRILLFKVDPFETSAGEVQCMVQKIVSSQSYLREALAKHGNTSVNHWKKRSIAKRTLLLQEVFPGIEPRKRKPFREQLF